MTPGFDARSRISTSPTRGAPPHSLAAVADHAEGDQEHEDAQRQGALRLRTRPLPLAHEETEEGGEKDRAAHHHGEADVLQVAHLRLTDLLAGELAGPDDARKTRQDDGREIAAEHLAVVAEAAVLLVLPQAPRNVDDETAPEHDHQHRHAAPRRRRTGLLGRRLKGAAALKTEVHACGGDAGEERHEHALLEVEFGDGGLLLLLRELALLELAMRYGQVATYYWCMMKGRHTQTICLFILGMLVGRKRWFYNENNNLALWKKVLAVSILVLIVGGIADVRHMETWNNWLYPIYNFFILSFVVSGFVLLWYGKEWFRKGLSFLRQFGKMSLTNYFLQSIIGCGLFAYYGFNLQTKLGITYAFFVGIAMVVVQCLFSNLWLKYHSHGPFEGIWKKLTWIKF